MKAILIDPTTQSLDYIELPNEHDKLVDAVGKILGTETIFHGTADNLPVYIFGNFESPWQPESVAFTHPFKANCFVGKTILTGCIGKDVLTEMTFYNTLDELRKKIFFFDKDDSEMWKKVTREFHEKKDPLNKRFRQY